MSVCEKWFPTFSQHRHTYVHHMTAGRQPVCVCARVFAPVGYLTSRWKLYRIPGRSSQTWRRCGRRDLQICLYSCQKKKEDKFELSASVHTQSRDRHPEVQSSKAFQLSGTCESGKTDDTAKRVQLLSPYIRLHTLWWHRLESISSPYLLTPPFCLFITLSVWGHKKVYQNTERTFDESSVAFSWRVKREKAAWKIFLFIFIQSLACKKHSIILIGYFYIL